MNHSRKKYQFLYYFIILPILMGGFRILSPFIKKIRAGLLGRKELEQRIKTFRETIGDKPVILFHCASAGEFESLRPLAKEFDREKVALAVSFFSPSAKKAAEKSKEFNFADYSPFDTKACTRKYYESLNPSTVVITKHDVWPGFVWTAKEMSIPIFLINGNFHEKSLKNLPLIKQFHRSVYRCFDEIMVVSEEDKRRASQIVGGDFLKIENLGDTRYDQTIYRAKNNVELPTILTEAVKDKKVLIIGSSHFDDENLIIPVVSNLLKQYNNFKIIIVPHDPSKKAKKRIEDFCAQYDIKLQDFESYDGLANMILVNKTGLLADLYKLGSIAYVGGGFGKGVHSVLEPLAHGLPVLCGVNISVSNEAREAVKIELVNVVKNRSEAEDILKRLLSHKELFNKMSKGALSFVSDRAGATQKIAQRIKHSVYV